MTVVVPTRPAATVVLLRQTPVGFSVFLVQRNRAVGFMPNAWVFPGGRVDAGDALAGHPRVKGGPQAIERLGLDHGVATAYLVAAARETFEESGLWLGEGVVPPEERKALEAREVGLAALLERHRATLDLDRLVPWSWWVTPDIEPKRFDTRFLVAVAQDGEARHDDSETVASAWITPAEAVARAESGELPMAPPTWWTLKELAAHSTIEAVLDAATRRPQRPVQPIVVATAEGFELRLPGHPEHPEPDVLGLPPAVRFMQGRWWADGTRIPSAS